MFLVIYKESDQKKPRFLKDFKFSEIQACITFISVIKMKQQFCRKLFGI